MVAKKKNSQSKKNRQYQSNNNPGSYAALYDQLTGGNDNAPVVQNPEESSPPGPQQSLRFEIFGPPGDRMVSVLLANGESVLADTGALAYCDGEVTMKTKAGSLKKFIGRAFAGETAFQNVFTGTSTDGIDQRVTLGPVIPSDIISFTLAPGEAMKLSRGAFIAGTPEVVVTGTLNWRGFFGVGQDEGGIISHVKSPPESGPAGSTFLASGFGIIERHDVAPGKTLMVNNERFFACRSDVQYDVVKIGNMKSFLFGGEGLVMRFKGPCTVWTQSHGLGSFAAAIADYLPDRD